MPGGASAGHEGAGGMGVGKLDGRGRSIIICIYICIYNIVCNTYIYIYMYTYMYIGFYIADYITFEVNIVNTCLTIISMSLTCLNETDNQQNTNAP